MRWRSGEASLARSRLGPIALASLLAVAACTGSDQPTTTATSPSLTSSTSTSAPPSLGELLVGALTDAEFSAEIAIEGRQITPRGTITSAGTGLVWREDSEALLVTDLSGLDGTFLDRSGRVIGAGGRSVITQGIRVVDGVQYRQDDGGRWRATDPAGADTTLRHVLSQLAEAAILDEAGTETLEGDELVVLRPSRPVEYHPGFFDLDPAVLEAFTSETEVLVDSAGTPVVVRLRLDVETIDGATYVWEFTYRLSNVGRAAPPAVPTLSWTPISSLGFQLLDWPTLFDIDVPTAWEVVAHDDGAMEFESQRGILAVFAAVLPGPTAIDQAMTEVLDELGLEPDEIEDPGLGVFPARLASAVDTEIGHWMVYAEAVVQQAMVIVLWRGPPTETVPQRQDFEEVLRTFRWVNDLEANGVPGETLTDTELQADTINLMIPLLSEDSDPNCDPPTVVWTTLVVGDSDGWVEDWFFDICDEVEIYDMEFRFSPQGGTDIAVDTVPRRLGTTPPGTSADPEAYAERLRRVPWLVEGGTDTDELTAAAAVANARFNDGNLYLLVFATEPEGDTGTFAEATLSHLGQGTLLVIGPDTVSWVTEGDIYTRRQVDEAIADALDGATNNEIIDRFVSSLIEG